MSNRVLGLVVRTGFVTLKGNLVRDILYPKANKFKFYRDSLIFVAVMALLAIAGFCLTLPVMIE
jgi:magnesium-transporting ATPase (P-type)